MKKVVIIPVLVILFVMLAGCISTENTQPVSQETNPGQEIPITEPNESISNETPTPEITIETIPNIIPLTPEIPPTIGVEITQPWTPVPELSLDQPSVPTTTLQA